MSQIVETLSLAFILILAVLLILHMLKGDAIDWISSKFQVGTGVTSTNNSGNPPPDPTAMG